jgi:hypothetical protein
LSICGMRDESGNSGLEAETAFMTCFVDVVPSQQQKCHSFKGTVHAPCPLA